MPLPYWDDDPALWNTLYIDEWVWRDTAVDFDGDMGHDWDVQKAPGADGAPATNKGYEPCKPKLTWTLYTREHWGMYQEMLGVAQPKPGKTAPIVVEVSHPLISVHRKVKFRIARVHLLKRMGKGMRQASLDLLEYFAAPKPVPQPPAQRPEREQALETRVIETPSKTLIP